MARANKTANKTSFLPAGASAVLRRRSIELAGLFLMLVATALFAALVTYNPADPSLNTAVKENAENLLRLPGAIVADLIIQSLGLAGGILVLIVLGWGWRLVVSHRVAAPWLRLALLPLGLLLATMALAAIAVPENWVLQAGLGGAAGHLLRDTALALVGGVAGDIGPWVFDVAYGLAAICLVFYVLGYSPREWRTGVSRLWGLFRGLSGLSSRISSPRKEKSEATPPRRSRRDERLEPTLGKASTETEGASVGIGPELAKSDLVAPKASRTVPGKKAEAARQRQLDLGSPSGEFELPSLDLIDDVPDSQKNAQSVNEEGLEQNARLLEGVLDDFGVRGEIVKVRPGPVVTLYELEPAPGTKTSRVIGLSDDIARSMSAVSVRCAVIPGRNVIGIELPNIKRETVYLRELLAADAYERASGKLPLVLGKDIGGTSVIVDLASMPHLLIAGTTGSGKSVGLNAMILSLLYRLKPDEAKLIMIDPKMLELSIYDGIPHLISPVVTEPRKAVVALKWAVKEMERRYRDMSKLGVRNVEGYNKRVAEASKKGEVLTRKVQTGFDAETGKPVIEEQPLNLTPLPHIVVVVDEMADLMLVAGKDVEAAIQRLAQMARAAGIHLIMATQRPSVDVVTGTIKANFPTRISFQVTSKVDSRTILGDQGAEQLLGQGDMLYMAGGGRITRVHGPLVHDDEVESVVRYLKSQGEPTYLESVTEDDEGSVFDMTEMGADSGDELYDRAIAVVCQEGKASTSFIQRHLQIGYNRAARIIEKMEKEGIVSPANHVGRREVLIGSPSEPAEP